jgi:hypothetical protein
MHTLYLFKAKCNQLAESEKLSVPKEAAVQWICRMQTISTSQYRGSGNDYSTVQANS